MGIAGTINQHGKITISLGTGNVATLKGGLDETGTDTTGIYETGACHAPVISDKAEGGAK